MGRIGEGNPASVGVRNGGYLWMSFVRSRASRPNGARLQLHERPRCLADRAGKNEHASSEVGHLHISFAAVRRRCEETRCGCGVSSGDVESESRYDHRRLGDLSSKSFFAITVKVFQQKGIPVYGFRSFAFTPLVVRFSLLVDCSRSPFPRTTAALAS